MLDHEEKIRQRAYEIWHQEGQPEGKHDEHWERAKREVGPETDDITQGDEAQRLRDQMKHQNKQ